MSFDSEPKRALSLNNAYDALSDEQINKNLSITGWLKKKSPAMLKGWQKRYFMTINTQNLGWRLVYFDNDKTDCKPNGAFDIQTIKEIQCREQCIMAIIFPGREMELKATSAAECQHWINVLNQCKSHVPKAKRQISLDQTIKMVDDSPNKETNHKKVDTMTMQLAQMEKESARQGGSTDLSKKEQKQKEKKSMEHLSNERMLELVGLRDYIKAMNEQFIQNRLIYGYIGKRSKGKMKYFQKRWFILVSAKPLFPQDYNDEKILQESQLPPWLELDTMLYFKHKEEGKAPKSKGLIKMNDCQEILIKNMQQSKENGYTFKLNMGDRLYHLTTDTEQERKRWQTALSASIQTAKETNNSLKIQLRKNIDPILKLYDSENSLMLRRDKLKQKLDQDWNHYQSNANLPESLKNIDYITLFNMLSQISRDMLESLQACVVKDPQRKDIIKEYIDYYHDKICDTISDYWDNTYTTIDSASMLKLSSWISDYQEQLKDYFNDDRLVGGVKVLLGIFVNRSLDSVEPVVAGILEYERGCQPFQNENEQLVSQSPVDLFKIINEGFDMAYNLCRCKETVIKMAHFCKVLIGQYQHGIEEILEETQMKVDKYVAICNNTIAFFEFTKVFQKRIQSLAALQDDDCDKIFGQQKITKQFVQISNIAREKFFFLEFRDISKHLKCFFLEIDVLEILKKLIEPAIELISMLHDSFSRKVWKQLLDVIVIFYFNAMIISCGKAKKDSLEDFIEKLDKDRNILTQEFESFLFESQLVQCLKPFDDMIEFLQNDSVSILQPCKNLRVFFGRAFTEKTIKQIFQIRNDIDKERKKDTIDACKDLIDEYNRQNKDEVVDIEKTRLLDVLGQEEDEQQGEKQEDPNSQEAQARRQDINLLDFNEDPYELEEKQQSQQIEEECKKDYIEEGFIYKKKPNQFSVNVKQLVKNWDYRYVRIRKGFMYWYINAKSREAQNKLDLTKIDDVTPHATKGTKFSIQLEGGKKYKFKALNKEERDLWIKTILKEQLQIEQVQVQKIEAIKTGSGKKPLIKDYDEIARKERQKQKAEERRKKRMEKELELKRKQSEKKAQQQAQVRELGEKTQTMKPQETFETEDRNENKNTMSCWTQFLIVIGMKRPQ